MSIALFNQTCFGDAINKILLIFKKVCTNSNAYGMSSQEESVMQYLQNCWKNLEDEWC